MKRTGPSPCGGMRVSRSATSPSPSAGMKAKYASCAHFVNRSGAPAQYIEVGSRMEADTASYPDDDLMWLPDGSPGHKDGTKY